MDNFTHSLFGWAIGQAGLKRTTRKGLAALILGANMPDLDVFFGWVSWAPLATHRGVTHGIAALVVLPPLLAGSLWLLDRWQQSRGAVFKSGLPMRFGWLLLLSLIGVLTHPLLDLQNTYAVQLLSPFDDRWFHNDALFIIDVWLWSGLAFAIWLSRRREKAKRAWQSPPRIALACAVAYIAGNTALSEFVKSLVPLNEPYRQPEVVFAGHEPVFFWRRSLVMRDDGLIWRGRSDGLAYRPMPELVPDNMELPVVRRAMRANPEIIDFMRWSVMPVARVTPLRCAVRVTFGDARYGGNGFASRARANFERTVIVPVAGTGCPASASALP